MRHPAFRYLPGRSGTARLNSDDTGPAVTLEGYLTG
jgi:hypothetical protein